MNRIRISAGDTSGEVELDVELLATAQLSPATVKVTFTVGLGVGPHPNLRACPRPPTPSSPPLPCCAELQSMVQTAFDEMEAVLASGRTGRTPPLRPRATRVLSGTERRELNLPSAPGDDRERSRVDLASLDS